MNPLYFCDGYKLSHREQMPAGTTRIYSNWTPRSSRVSGQDEVVFFGLQYLIKRYFMEDMARHFFREGKFVAVAEYQKFTRDYLGTDEYKVAHLVALWELGYLPLRICALPEGSTCPLRVPVLTVENTHPAFFWLTNYFETLLSTVLWLPCTSATTAHRMRKLLDGYAIETGGDLGFVPWQGHDFSMRGMAGVEAGMLSGAGHLLSFTGTDTIPAIRFLERYYPLQNGEPARMIGGSVPATEHSVMSCGGEASEAETFARLLDLYPKGIVSVVSDTWNLWDVLGKILPALKGKIVERNGKLVIRPDSGDPVDILCGKKDAASETERKGVVELLWDLFGGQETDKGYKQLDAHVGVIYGDSINYDRASTICLRLSAKGFASTNVVFGIGSYTYNYVTRDTYGWAMKATWAEVNGVGRDLFKKPVTDDGTKFSATGRLSVVRDPDSGKLQVIERASREEEAASLLRPVWENGRFLTPEESYQTIRNRLWNCGVSHGLEA